MEIETRNTLTLTKSQKIEVRNLNIWYGDAHAIKDASLKIRKNNVTALIGPSGCGKSTFLRALNRMNDFIDDCVTKGSVGIDGTDIYRTQYTNVNNLRKSVGMVFQKPNPFPKSIYENVAYGPQLHRMHESKAHLDEIVKNSLQKANLWDEVKNRLTSEAFSLSGGQQQRLCIARTLAVDPQVVLLDEPCSALDPISTNAIEQLILELKKSYTIVMVTYNMQQAKRISDTTAYFHLGEIVEVGATKKIFGNPNHRSTRAYVSGEFG
ncbi:MAG: phosphate ABC transporter ATP-binding protein [Candidatus Marinimicrobia bacterium]|nr:phosphate ABC transporter ATP-binding protein [Candidatus Neomarinimicrobiota bacterium]